jgi:hypothetical protein
MPQVTGPLTTTSSTDSYPTHDSLVGLGGLRSVTDTTARNAIPNARRTAGMLVYTTTDDKYWKLKPSAWNGTDSDWSIANVSGGVISGITLFDSSGAGWNLSITTNGNLNTVSTSTSGYPNTRSINQ